MNAGLGSKTIGQYYYKGLFRVLEQMWVDRRLRGRAWGFGLS